MIVDSTDPTSNGLFSRCGRSHAAKNRSTHEAVSYEPRPRKPLQIAARRVNNSLATFDMSETRLQRQKRGRPQQTPPVGIYKVVKPERPKMVWDIIKVFHGSQKHRGQKKSIRGSMKKVDKQASESDRPRNQTFASPSSTCPDLNQKRCLVNMNRTTGRRQTEVSNLDWGDMDMIKAMAQVKPSLTKNIYFGKQKALYPRKTQTQSSSNYTYDYRLLKPRHSALVDFSLLKGRDRGPVKTQGSYSYQHYDYEGVGSQYASNIFPNTKTHLITFDKQLNRYGRVHTEEPANY